MNASERDIKRMLQFLRKCHNKSTVLKQWHYRGPADLLLREGKFYQPGDGPTRWNRSMPQACFRNAALYAITHRLRYVEGYATGVMPVHHGWCVDAQGKVVEVTWDFMGAAYFGVEFPPMSVTRGVVLFNDRNVAIYRRELKQAKKS